LLVPTQVTALVTSPHIGSLERPAAAALTARCVRNNLLIALAVCGALFAGAYPLVRFLYGPAFLPTVGALQILLLGVFAMSLSSPISSYFTLKLGKPEVALILAGTSAVICIATSLALVPSMSIYGAAIASSAAYITAQCAALWYFSRTTAINVRTVLLPTREDLQLYRRFLARLLSDIRPHFPRPGTIPNSPVPPSRR
jgi:O-antigen/teichoic acid export membrane protein